MDILESINRVSNNMNKNNSRNGGRNNRNYRNNSNIRRNESYEEDIIARLRNFLNKLNGE